MISIRHSYNVDENIDIGPISTVISILYQCHTVIDINASILYRYQDVNKSMYQYRYYCIDTTLIRQGPPRSLSGGPQVLPASKTTHPHITVETGLVGADVCAGVLLVLAAHGCQRRAEPRQGAVNGEHREAVLTDRATLRVLGQ